MKYIKSAPIEFTDPDIGRSSSGHKFHNWITGLYLSKIFNLEYIYSPFTQDAARYESFLNLHTGYRHLKDIKPYKQVQLPFLEFCHSPETPSYVFDNSLKTFKTIIDSHPDETLFYLNYNPFPGLLTQYYQKVIPELQTAYWNSEKHIPIFFHKEEVNIAIHIRRGDITENKNPDRWLDLKHYVNIIRNLKENLTDFELKFYIFSEGREEYFKELLIDSNIFLILGQSDLSAVYHMTLADILVTGQSSFSIMAAYLNKNFIIYTPLKNYMHEWNSDRIKPYDAVDYDHLKEFLIKINKVTI